MSAASILKQQLRVARKLWDEDRVPELEHFKQAVEKAEQEWKDQQPKAAVNFVRRKKPESHAGAGDKMKMLNWPAKARFHVFAAIHFRRMAARLGADVKSANAFREIMREHAKCAVSRARETRSFCHGHSQEKSVGAI